MSDIEKSPKGVDGTQKLNEILVKRREEKQKQEDLFARLNPAAQSIIKAAEERRNNAYDSAVEVITDTFDNLSESLLLAKKNKVYNEFVEGIEQSLVEVIAAQFAAANIVEMHAGLELSMEGTKIALKDFMVNEGDVKRSLSIEKDRWLSDLKRNHNRVSQDLNSAENQIIVLYQFATKEISAAELKESFASAQNPSNNLFKQWDWNFYKNNNVDAINQELESTAKRAQQPQI